MSDITGELQWMIIAGGCVAFVAAFGIGMTSYIFVIVP